ncbi:MAG TPA: hypothetical protein VGK48_27135 [Terriglobia bacterium]|jgi:hypothetical protein
MKDKQGPVLGAMTAMNLILVIAFGYSFFSTNNTLTDRVARLESAADSQEERQHESSKQQSSRAESAKDEKQMADILSDLGVIKEKIGVTSTELKRARETAQSLKRKQEETEEQLASQLASKADSTDIDGLKETTTKLAEVQQDSSGKIGSVSGELAGLKQDLAATREDWGRQLTDVKTVLSEGIARNSGELAQLKKKGERDYFEFDIRKNSKPPFYRVADIQLSLLKTDPGKHKYNVAIQVDDNRLEKKDRTANEPVQFLVGRDQLRYEVVVNSVEKDHIRGYVSAPKDKTLSAEIPQFRQ